MIKINLICIGDIKEKYLREAIGEYSKRISRFAELKIIELKEHIAPTNNQTDIFKALEKDANGVDALYNLGNSLLFQQKAKDAMDNYQIAEKHLNESSKLAQLHHNMGVIHQSAKDYASAVEAYKQALRENPNDHETRYNLALAMHQLKNQQQQQNEQQEDKEQEQEKQQQEQQQQQQQQDKQKQEEQKEQEQQQQQQNQHEQQQEMSKENAEQLLQAAMQDEKDVQEKVKKMMQMRGRKLEKDW